MTQIRKWAWYGSSVAFAALLVTALLVIGSVERAQAASTTDYGTVVVATDNSPPAMLVAPPGNDQGIDIAILRGTGSLEGVMNPSATFANVTGSIEFFALAVLLFALAAVLHRATAPSHGLFIGFGAPWVRDRYSAKEGIRRISAGRKPHFKNGR